MTKTYENDLDRYELHLRYVFERQINFKERIIVLNEVIEDCTFNTVDSAITEMESYSRQPITIKLCSPGGSVHAALAIVGRIRKSKCKIIVEGYGQIASAATLIFAVCKDRQISEFATFMHHESRYFIEGRHSAVMSEVINNQKGEELWAEWLAVFSKKTKKFYLEESKNTDKYWTPAQLIEFGIADRII